MAPVTPGKRTLLIEIGQCGQRSYKVSSFKIYPVKVSAGAAALFSFVSGEIF